MGAEFRVPAERCTDSRSQRPIGKCFLGEWLLDIRRNGSARYVACLHDYGSTQLSPHVRQAACRKGQRAHKGSWLLPWSVEHAQIRCRRILLARRPQKTTSSGATLRRWSDSCRCDPWFRRTRGQAKGYKQAFTHRRGGCSDSLCYRILFAVAPQVATVRPATHAWGFRLPYAS